MSYQAVIGVTVLDDEKFDEYCLAIQPVLANFGGNFCYDLKVPSAILSRTHRNINRVLTIQFPGKIDMEAFFQDREYLKTRGRHLLKAIGDDQIIFGFERESRLSN